ncbi:hypothetical protein EYC59_02870 [Candidatus Saccharibacteria bacterium]|nr:MAG: hypothetical protein EYC59_02870 [Candidatus Saccharibacteria bacterium]
MSEQASRRIVEASDTKEFFRRVGGNFAKRLIATGYSPEDTFAIAILLGGAVQTALDEMVQGGETQAGADADTPAVDDASVELRIVHELGDFTDGLVPVDDGAASVVAPNYAKT